MKIINYKLGKHAVTIPYNDANLILAKSEALNGVFTIEDDGTVGITPVSTDARLKQIEEFLSKLKLLFPNV